MEHVPGVVGVDAVTAGSNDLTYNPPEFLCPVAEGNDLRRAHERAENGVTSYKINNFMVPDDDKMERLGIEWPVWTERWGRDEKVVTTDTPAVSHV